ncbi:MULTISPECIES: HaeIII family restriction endonuclease [Vibrio]|uniref:HaeIII family restriction endonuclease n=1 Tax=Vibrio TaxID=662 RepID=UPI0020949339|nr:MULTISPECIES: HaeIII family restriction endonuclease [Vibrio]ELY5256476.1 HaeIII family restriction endonuclease [Vibrio cholerae]MCO7020844.1 HaeIII family restriction endonuclease [Vibrio paracholerae]MDA5315637.1 HaeIII family restriction endonuclease [Vibrio cholerae]
MANSTSNDNGRALEYALTQALIRYYPTARIDEQTKHDQIRDLGKLKSLPDNVQAYFVKNTDYFVSKILPSRIGYDNEIIKLSRLTDTQGTRGDVTDIRLWLVDGYVYNISLKHNHEAVKHPRPGSLIDQLGINNDLINKEYRNKVKAIEKDFYNNLLEGETTFNVVKQRNPDIILNLYRNICNNYINYLNKYRNCAEEYFSFIVGIYEFEKVIITRNKIDILNFYNIPRPTDMRAEIYNNSYIDVHFDNGISFRSRLHTASSRINLGRSISLKFDTNILYDEENYINRCSIDL